MAAEGRYPIRSSAGLTRPMSSRRIQDVQVNHRAQRKIGVHHPGQCASFEDNGFDLPLSQGLHDAPELVLQLFVAQQAGVVSALQEVPDRWRDAPGVHPP